MDVLGSNDATAIAWAYLDGYLGRKDAIEKLVAMGADSDEADDFLTAEAFEAMTE